MEYREYQMRLTNFIERARRFFPEKEIVSREADGEIVRHTYLDEYKRICRLANILKDLGVKRGDVLGSFAWNTHRHYELYFSIPCMGATLHTINIRLSLEDIIYSIDQAEDIWIFIEEGLIPKFEPCARHLKTVKGYIILSKKKDMKNLPDTVLSPVYLYEDLISGASEEYDFPDDMDENTPASIFYTGGTTGRPKGVVYTHRHMFLRSLALTSVEQFAIGQRDTIINVVPLFHINGWYLPQTATLVGAQQVYPGGAITPEIILQLIEQERVTFSGGVPTVWLDCLNFIKSGKVKYDLSSLRLVVVGGSAMPRKAMEEYNQMGISFAHAYGSSESPFLSTAFLRPEVEDISEEDVWKRKSSVGYAFPGYEFKVVHEDGTEVKWNGKDTGEVICRSPWTINHYYKAPEQSAKTFKNGWYHFGDLATVDKFGYINLVDRVKDIIKSGGEWISSIELENTCMAYHAVSEACAVGVEHERWTERPILFVVPYKEYEGKLREKEILDFLSSRHPKWWLPDRVFFLDAIPRTGPGKFDKKLLRSEYGKVLLKK